MLELNANIISKHYRQMVSRVAVTLVVLFATTLTVQASESEYDYMYHRPIGHIETIEPKAASLSVTGWGLDLDGNHMTNVSIILKQNGTVKYEFVVETNEYRGSFYGNAYFRGYHGFNLNSVAVVPGTYQISGIVEYLSAMFADEGEEETEVSVPTKQPSF